MIHNQNQWPIYGSPHEMLHAETRPWGPRLEAAQTRYSSLDGELPYTIDNMAIAIIDGHTESPESFSLLDVYDRHGLDPDSTGALLGINYEGTMPDNARDLIDVIHEQRARVSQPTAIALLGYAGKRRIDQLRTDVWDIPVAHALYHEIDHSIVGISNDADLEDFSADYVPQMAHNSYVGQPALVWGSEVEFSQPGGADLPLHKLVAYLNGGRQIMKSVLNKPVIYGGSMALTLETYVASGSWMGAHDRPNVYGIGEPSRLILNAWERLTGKEGTMTDAAQPYEACARRVGGLAVVSPRREIFAFARDMGKTDNLIAHLNTEPTNPYRGIGDDEIALMADSVSSNDPAFIAQIDKLDSLFLESLPGGHLRTQVQEAQRMLREKLELPLATR